MKFFTRRKILLTIATILGLIAAVKFYKYIGRNIVYKSFYSQEIVEAFANADVSIQKPVTCNPKISGNIWLISYANGGKWVMNQNGLAASAINKCVDVIKIYSSKHIDPAYFEAHKSILSAKRGAGYWLWKPYLILKTLNEMPENDILLYLDTGISIIHPLDSMLDHLKEKDIAFFNQGFKNKNYIKKELFQIMDMDFESPKNADMADASRILVRNTSAAREFIQEWLYWAEKPEAIADSDKSNEYPEFIDHRHDQSILSLLYLKHKNDIHLMNGGEIEYFFHHRRYDFNKRSLIFSHDPITSFEAWLSDAAYKAYNDR